MFHETFVDVCGSAAAIGWYLWSRRLVGLLVESLFVQVKQEGGNDGNWNNSSAQLDEEEKEEGEVEEQQQNKE